MSISEKGAWPFLPHLYSYWIATNNIIWEHIHIYYQTILHKLWENKRPLYNKRIFLACNQAVHWLSMSYIIYIYYVIYIYRSYILFPLCGQPPKKLQAIRRTTVPRDWRLLAVMGSYSTHFLPPFQHLLSERLRLSA